MYKSIDELIGKTPLIELKNIKEKYGLSANIFAKVEYFNPAGSIKDRVGLKMIDEAEKSGKLKKGSVIIEPTSGNTGIGIASVAASRGYKAIIVMPETMSEERKILMKAYGAELVLTDGKKGMSGAMEEAKRLNLEIPGSIIAGQFENEANPMAHYETTGPEIYADMNGKIDIFVAGVGTGGTITGVGRYLKEQNENIQIVAVEPEKSPVLSQGKSGAHGIQGIGAGFVPKVLDTEIYDSVMCVTDDDAIATSRNFGKCQGFLIGISSGAALFAAIEIAKREANREKNIVCVFPDSGDRYLSTSLYK